MMANVLNYIFHLAIGRLVSVETYGEVQSITALINIIIVPAATLTMVAAKYAACSKADDNKKESLEIFKYLNKKVFIYGLPIFIVAVIFSPYVGNFLNIRNDFALFLMWLMMFGSFFTNINVGILNGWQKFKSSSWVSAFGALVKLIAGVVLVKIGFDLNGVMGSLALGAVASYIASIYTLKFLLTDKNEKKDQAQECISGINFNSIKGYAMPAFIGSLAINILGNADMIMAKHNLEAEVAGQYGALTIVSKIIYFGTGVLATVLFSMSAEDNHKKQNPIMLLRNASILMFLLTGFATMAYFIFPEIILGMLFGSKYFAVSHFLGWFAVLVSLFSFSNLLFLYLISIHRTKIVYYLLGVSVFFSMLILFYGKSIYAIITLMSSAQIFAIVGALISLYDKKNDQ